MANRNSGKIERCKTSGQANSGLKRPSGFESIVQQIMKSKKLSRIKSEEIASKNYALCS